MKKMVILFVVTLIVISINLNYAQDTTNIPLKEYNFALQFQIDYNFRLEPFQGSTVSFKYQFNEMSALRFGVTVNISVDTYNEEDGVEEYKSKSYSYPINLQYIHYLEPVEDISLYFGGGPYMDYSYSEYDYDTYQTFRFGLSCILGVEWFFKSNMGLSIEYGTLIYHEENKRYKNTILTKHTKSIELNTNNMCKFGLSVYFRL